MTFESMMKVDLREGERLILYLSLFPVHYFGSSHFVLLSKMCLVDKLYSLYNL